MYRDGSLVFSNATNYTGYWIDIRYLGKFEPGSSNFLNGTIRNPRIYNRALTAAEIWELANSPDAYNLDRVTRSVTPVPGSVMTRGPAGIIRLAASTPASATAPGEVGQFAYDSGFLYICTATNTWKRIGVAAW